MFTNLLFFLLLVALIVLFGWLTWRAIRAKRLWVKIVGGILAGLLTLVFAVVTFYAGKGMAAYYIAPAPVEEITVEGAPEQIARGEYLVNIGCTGCHSVNGEGKFPLTGGLDIAGDLPMPIGKLVAENITPGGVLAERSDGELFRLLRHGFGPKQRAGMMTFMPFRQLSDDDIKAMIAFLRSQESVPTEFNGGDEINLLGLIMFFGTGIFPAPETHLEPIQAPPAGETPEYGKYVATFGECRGCHGDDMTGSEATAITPAVPNPRPAVSAWTREQFIQAMRTGVRPDGNAFAEDMPWTNASKMTDEDLGALYIYLTTAP